MSLTEQLGPTCRNSQFHFYNDVFVSFGICLKLLMLINLLTRSIPTLCVYKLAGETGASCYIAILRKTS